MLYIADWVLTSLDETPGDGISFEQYSLLYRKILSYCKSIGMTEYYSYDKNRNQYFETPQRDAEIMPHINNYDNHVFWDELIRRMAMRDSLSELGWDRPTSYRDNKKKFEQWAEVFSRKEALYANEFSKNGTDNLIVDDPDIRKDAKRYLQ